jgi:parallel beta-helix repeat protein
MLIVGESIGSEVATITEDIPGDTNFGEFSLGGLLNPNGIRESPTTRIITPEELLQELPGPTPAAIDNSAGLPPVGSQQSQASCSAWSIGYYHATFIENKEKPFDLAAPENQVSPAFLYNIANGGYNGGADMNDVADLLISNGACSMAEMPYDTGDYTSWPDEDWMWVSGMKRKAVSKTWLQITQKQGMDALKAHLAAGNTAVTHIQVYSNFDYIRDFNNVYSSAEKYGTDRGGHAVAICGYDDTFPTADGPGALRMVNSWGTGWGDAGYWWLSYGAVKDSSICYGRAMYLTSEVNYQPRLVAKAYIDHPYRGDIVKTSGLGISVIEGGSTKATKSFLGCPQIEGYYNSYGYPIQQYPFPAGKMAFDISSFITSMNPLVNHDFRLSMNNKGTTPGTLASFEILNPELWEGGLCWNAPLTVTASSTTLAHAWVTPGIFYHMPIRVDSGLDMAHQAIGEFWGGSGAALAPFVIPGYIINGTGYGYCLYIGNTTDHFQIRDSYLHHASGYPVPIFYTNASIILYNVLNGEIFNNNAISNYAGIHLLYASNNRVADNMVSNNMHGIALQYSCNNTIFNNTASNCSGTGFIVGGSSNGNHVINNIASNDYVGFSIRTYSNYTYVANNVAMNDICGFQLMSTEGNTVVNNTATFNTEYGIFLTSAKNNSILNNNASNNYYGLNITFDGNNTIADNIISNNVDGIDLCVSENNRVYHNSILSNFNQAFDNSLNIWHNGYPSGGNYWSDFTGIDSFSGPSQDIPGCDGIGDTPYYFTDSQDDYPLMAPWSPPPIVFYNISLAIGWNLISIPLAMADDTVENVLSSISGSWDAVKYYDSADSANHWKSCRPASPVNTLANIDSLMGVWLHATENCTLAISGEARTNNQMTFRAGWNLVGYPSLNSRSASDALAGTGADRIAIYDGASSSFMRDITDLSTVTMAAGSGYWVHVPADVIWTLNW